MSTQAKYNTESSTRQLASKPSLSLTDLLSFEQAFSITGELLPLREDSLYFSATRPSRNQLSGGGFSVSVTKPLSTSNPAGWEVNDNSSTINQGDGYFPIAYSPISQVTSEVSTALASSSDGLSTMSDDTATDVINPSIPTFSLRSQPLSIRPYGITNFGNPIVSTSLGGVSAPVSYDLRTLGLVTPVKDQGGCGSCWAFGTYASLESSILKMGGPLEDFSENHLKNYHGFDWGPCDGGNDLISTAYLSRGDGPVDEIDDPYHDWDDRPSPGGIPRYYVGQTLWFDTDAEIKEALMSQGVLATYMYWDNPYFNDATDTYYYSGSQQTNHCVSIVGWDDNKTVSGTSTKGAWLIKNSWGTGFGNQGYFWISYADSQGANGGISFSQATSPYNSIYDYDDFGFVTNWNSPYGFNAYTAQADEPLEAVGFYTLADGASYEIKVYDTFQSGKLTDLLSSVSGTMSFQGYHTVELPTPVSLEAGDKFYVSLHLTNGGAYPLASDGRVSGYSSGCTALSGQSYWSFDGNTWSDLYSADNTANFCIKALVGASTTLPDLTPFKPIGWSGPIVISTTTGTTTDASQITTADTLYIDWAALNQGTGATSVTFKSRLLLDGTPLWTWNTNPPLNPNYYAYVSDYQKSPLSAGSHTLALEVDYLNEQPETLETNNFFQKTFNVVGLQANLAIAATDANKNEGNSGNTPFTFTVTRSGSTTGTNSVSWAVTGSGTNPSNTGDFGGTFPSGTLAFAANETSKVITVNVSGDTTVEPDETFTVTLSNPTNGATITTATATGTIKNDDVVTPTLAIAATDANKNEGNSGNTPFTFTVTRSGSTAGTNNVSWAVTGGSTNPANTADFGGTFPSGTLAFAANETSKVITVNVSGDTTNEPDETFNVTLSNPTNGATITTATATGTIKSDDPPSSPPDLLGASFDVTPEPLSAGSSFDVQYKIQNAGGSNAGPFAVNFYLSLNSYISSGDKLLGSATIDSLAANSTTATLTRSLTLPSPGDPFWTQGNATYYIGMVVDANSQVNESNESNNANRGDSLDYDGVSITVTPTTTLAIAATNAVQNEGNSGNKPFTFTVTRAGSTTGTNNVSWAVTGGSTNPANGADFGGTFPSGTLAFVANETSKVITVNVSGDTTVEPDETFTVTLSNPTNGATITTATAAGTILNDDGTQPSTVSFSAANYSADEGIGISQLVKLNRSGSLTSPSTVKVSIIGGTATGGVDYNNDDYPLTVTFAANESSKTVPLSILNDSVVEGTESVFFELNSVTNAVIGSPDVAVLKISDNDIAPTIEFSQFQFQYDESAGNNAAITLTRSGRIANASQVQLSLIGGSATPGEDFNAEKFPLTVTFAANETSKRITVPILEDTIAEAKESIVFQVNALSNATIGAQDSALLQILDNEGMSQNIGTDEEDLLRGTSKNDKLVGGLKADILRGYEGDDVLIGGAGADILRGGNGNDRFVYESLDDAGDRIRGFKVGKDLIDLSQIFANSQAYKSENPFLDYLRLTPLGTGTSLQVDPDGDLGSRGWRTLATLEEIAPLALSSSSFII